MRRLTGIIMMATIAYAGHLAINHYFTDNFEEKQAFSNLRTKLQKTLVMIDVSPAEKSVEKKLTTQVIKKKSSATRSAVSHSKPAVINTMKSTYDSLAKVSHIFRHEVAEMIEIIEKSAPSKKLSAKLTYAKNWSSYIKNNVQKFNMSQANKNHITNMVVEMQNYISGLTGQNKVLVKPVQKANPPVKAKVQPIVNTRKIEPVEVKKVVSAKTVAKKVPTVNKTANTSTDAVDSIVKASIKESLVALKQWESSRKEANSIVGSFSGIWLAVVGLFAMIALWMSKTQNVDKLIVTEASENIEAIDEPAVQEETHAFSETEENTKSVEPSYFFDEISNSLSNLCQAKGIILDTDELEGCSEIVEKYELSEVEQEMEDFTKTIIRSLGKEGIKTVKLHFNEKATKLKMVASVSSENPLDINMTRVASGFRSLEEKLASRKGVFNIEQSISGNDIDFVMQLTAKEQFAADGKSEINNVEEVGIVPPTV